MSIQGYILAQEISGSTVHVLMPDTALLPGTILVPSDGNYSSDSFVSFANVLVQGQVNSQERVDSAYLQGAVSIHGFIFATDITDSFVSSANILVQGSLMAHELGRDVFTSVGTIKGIGYIFSPESISGSAGFNSISGSARLTTSKT